METIICVGKRGYLVSLLVWVALKKLKKWATADLTQENKLKFILLVVIFSPWAGFGRNQNPVRRPAWLWHAVFWASSQGCFYQCLPLPLDVPTFAARCLQFPKNASAVSGKRWNCGREWCPVILPKYVNHSGSRLAVYCFYVLTAPLHCRL
jgi:hypothetical protein